jgi:Zn-dependent M28 family amino/carboxypeptidase
MKPLLKVLKYALYPFAWRIVHMPGSSYKGTLPSLADHEQAVKANLLSHVNRLALEIGQRNARNYEGLKLSAQFIEDTLRSFGYAVRSETFVFDGVEMRNIEAESRGASKPEEIVVIGAHYDTVYESPGADDNASGVAAMLEIARLLKDTAHSRTLRFVAFANEENPGGTPWETMGSYAYARGCHQRGEKIVAMLSLEMVGVYSDAEGSQAYPMPFKIFYPTVGNFIGFVANTQSRDLVTRCIGSFRRHTKFPSEGCSAPDKLRDINRSDHWSFWQFGYQALMVTDTSNFRNHLYHTMRDTPEILDFDRMSRVATGLSRVVDELVNS